MRTILTILFLATIVICKAQTYQSTILNNDSLMILFDRGFYEGITQNVKISEDSIIEDFNYKKLNIHNLETEIFNEIICSPDCYNYNHDNLFLREDSSHSKLFLFSGMSKQEYLIMNLNLQKNDTFRIVKNNEDDLIFSVDTVYVDNNKKIIEFKNSREFERHGTINLKFIEGIGPNWGFFYGFNDANNLLLCSYKNGIQTFKVTDDSQCEYWWVGDEWPDYIDNLVENADDIFSFSNLQSLIYIRTAKDFIYKINIYDINGKLVYLNTGARLNTVINLKRNSIYLVKVTFENKFLTKKILTD